MNLSSFLTINTAWSDEAREAAALARQKKGYKLPLGVPPFFAKLTPTHASWQQHKNWKQQAYGAVLVNGQGHFLLREPAHHFDGYAWTWPKGKMDNPKEHPLDTAVREVGEESGYRGRIIGHVPGNYGSGSGSNSNFYLMRPASFDATKMDRETKSLRWASYDDAKQLIEQSKNKGGRARDLAILDQAHQAIQKYRQG